MGSLLSTLFSFTQRLNALKFTKNALEKQEFDSSAESVTVTVVQPSADPTDTKAQLVTETQQEAPMQSLVPQVEPNLLLQPYTKRRSKPELCVYCPLANGSSIARLEVHEFIWKYGGKQVFLAGSFNSWNPHEIEMVPADVNSEYHQVRVELDPTQSWEFKFVVDGVWRCSLDIATTTDAHGNTNNIIYPDRE